MTLPLQGRRSIALLALVYVIGIASGVWLLYATIRFGRRYDGTWRRS